MVTRFLVVFMMLSTSVLAQGTTGNVPFSVCQPGEVLVMTSRSGYECSRSLTRSCPVDGGVCITDGGVMHIENRALTMLETTNTIECNVSTRGQVRSRTDPLSGHVDMFLCDGDLWRFMTPNTLAYWTTGSKVVDIVAGDMLSVVAPVGTEGSMLYCSGVVKEAGECTGSCIPPQTASMSVRQSLPDGGSSLLCTLSINCQTAKNTAIPPQFCGPNMFTKYDLDGGYGNLFMRYDPPGLCSKLPYSAGTCVLSSGFKVLAQ